MAGVGEGPLGTKLHSSATKVSYPRPTRVKNKAPAPTQVRATPPDRPTAPSPDSPSRSRRFAPEARPRTSRSVADPTIPSPTAPRAQITAEQIVRESLVFGEEQYQAPERRITSIAELQEYRVEKRQQFENNLRKNGGGNLREYLKYAAWEDTQGDIARARSIFERAVESCDYREPNLWLKYAELEMRAKKINHARNVWDRAVTLLPRVDQLWYVPIDVYIV